MDSSLLVVAEGDADVTKLSAGRVRSTYEVIKAHRDRYSVQAMCRILGVAPSGYYEWFTHPISNRAQEDARLFRLIRASFTASQGIYGAPRVFLDLREAGESCSKHRVARLMRVSQLRALHGYRTRRWSVGKPAVLIPNILQRQFTVTRHLHSDVAGLALPGRRDDRAQRLQTLPVREAYGVAQAGDGTRASPFPSTTRSALRTQPRHQGGEADQVRSGPMRSTGTSTDDRYPRSLFVMLRLSSVAKAYPNGIQALQDINLEIPKGLFGLLGPNGAGKSTLMRTIATLQAPDSGEIRFDAIDVLREKTALRRQLGYLPQEFGSYPRTSAEMMLRHFAALKGLHGAQQQAAVEQLLLKTNLWEVRKRSVDSFSGGMKQR